MSWVPSNFYQTELNAPHIETPRCKVSYKEGAIADLLEHLKQTLHMFSPELLVGRDLYELKCNGPDEELIVTIIYDADQSSETDYHSEEGEFVFALEAFTCVGCWLLAVKIY